MAYPAEPDWNVTSDYFADENLDSLLRGDWKEQGRLVGLHAHAQAATSDRQTG